jgi:hypothetical protein
VSVNSELPPSMMMSPSSRWGQELIDHFVDRLACLDHDQNGRLRDAGDKLRQRLLGKMAFAPCWGDEPVGPLMIAIEDRDRIHAARRFARDLRP